MKPKKLFLLVTILVLAILSTLISNSIDKTNTDNRSQAASTPKVFFPEDHTFHTDFPNEWWYINLVIRTDDKETRDTGYLISLGKVNGKPGLLTSKYDNYNKTFIENTYSSGDIGSTLEKTDLFTISYIQKNGPKFTLKELPPLQNRAKRYSLKGYSEEVGTLDLTFTEKTVISKGFNTPLLWGCNGKISVFKDNDTFYYSIPDLDITGTVIGKDGLVKNVKVGKAWMDHQWFNSSPKPDSKGDYWIGHYWTGHHLTQRSDFTGPHTAIGAVTQIYRNKDGTKDYPKYSYWVKRNLDGTNDCGTGGVKFEVENKDKDGYPSQIKVSITDSNKQSIYSGTIRPFNQNQVFNEKVVIFEPVSYMSGTLGKKNVTGLGFLETGIRIK